MSDEWVLLIDLDFVCDDFFLFDWNLSTVEWDNHKKRRNTQASKIERERERERDERREERKSINAGLQQEDRRNNEDGPNRGSNPAALAPKARIIPLDHQVTVSSSVFIREFNHAFELFSGRVVSPTFTPTLWNCSLFHLLHPLLTDKTLPSIRRGRWSLHEITDELLECVLSWRIFYDSSLMTPVLD